MSCFGTYIQYAGNDRKNSIWNPILEIGWWMYMLYAECMHTVDAIKCFLLASTNNKVKLHSNKLNESRHCLFHSLLFARNFAQIKHS